MISIRSLLAASPLLALVLAQTNIAFTSVPAVAVAGESYNITWGGGDGTDVTITLRKGEPNDLTTVGTLVDGAPGSWWLWEVSTSLTTANDYALQITQGQSDINYSGLFTITGGSGTSTISASTTATGNSTTRATATPTITEAAGTISAGTGTAVPRNTTFSSASLTRSSSDSATFGEATSTSSRSSRTAAATSQSTSAPDSNAATHMGSSAALVMGLFAAIMCLS